MSLFQSTWLARTVAVLALAVFIFPALADDKKAGQSQSIGVEGTIMDIQPNAQELKLRTTDGRPLDIMVSDQCWVQLEGVRKGKLSDLKMGETASVIYYKVDGKNKAALVTEGKGGAGEIPPRPPR